MAVRGALTYFLVDQLWVLDHLYRFSMANFVMIFKKGMDVADMVIIYEKGIRLKHFW